MHINGREVALDNDGHLINLNDWDTTVAQLIAAQENITLSDKHWEIIYLLRNFYSDYQIAPAMRALSKYAEKKLSADKGRSTYLLQLFPPSPARIASKIAGLPRPANCF